MTNHKIYFGDSRALNKIEDKSVQLIITSPPYWQLKDYGSNNQIGFNNSYEEYINNLNLVWMECERILSEGCRLCINIGDQFARSVYYGRYKVVPIRTEIIRFCEALKMDYMGAIIWQKATTMNTSGGGAIMGSFPYPRNGILKIDYEFILIFKKLGNPPKPTLEQKENSIMTKEEWNQLLDLILEKSIYKVIILDLGDTVDGLYDLLGRCSKVYTPYIEEGAAKAKLNQYEENLRSAGYGEILKKTVRRRMGKPRNPVALEASASKITEFPDRERKS